MSAEKERLHYIPVYINDLTSDELVEAMTTEEFGAYLLLLFKAWKSDPPATIPDDDLILARWARLPMKQWLKCRARVLAPWKPFEGGRLVQKRLLRVRGEVTESVVKRKEAGAKGGLAKAAKRQAAAAAEVLANGQQCSSNATDLLDQSQELATSKTVANTYQSNTKTKINTSNEVNTPPPPPPESAELAPIPGRSGRRPMSVSLTNTNDAIVSMEIGGELVTYDANPMGWEAEFIRWWNTRPGVIQRHPAELDTGLREALIDRLNEPDWFWRRAEAKFPLWTPSGWQPTLHWFLESQSLSKILGGKYEQRTHKQAGLFATGPAVDPTRIRTGNKAAAIAEARAKAAGASSPAADNAQGV